MIARATQYFAVAAVLAAIAGLQIHHELSAGDAPDVLACMAPQSKMEAFRETLLLHLHGH